MAFPDKNYVLGKGKVYFGRFAEGTRVVAAGGQRYLGNTPEFNISQDSDQLDHYDDDNGIRIKDDSVQLELNRTGSFITDHISPENVAMWFSGSASVVSQAVLTDIEETFDDVTRNTRIQIGRTAANPSGVRGLTTVTAVSGATPLVEGTDFRVDKDTGAIFILPGSTVIVADGSMPVTITYSAAAVEYNRVISGNTTVEGEIFFEATNPKGVRVDYLLPYVQLRADGDYALKGDEWQQLSFNYEALKLDDDTEVVYTNGRAGIGV